MKKSSIASDWMKCLCVLAAAAALSGCFVTSVNPWLDRDGAVATPSLAGTWTDTNNSVAATFKSAQNPGRYDVTLVSVTASNRSVYECSLHTMDSRLLLQVGPGGSPESPGAILPAYMLMRVELTNDTMRLYQIDRRSFEGRANRAGLILAAGDPRKKEKRFTADSEPIIAGSWTTELETFVKKNLGETNFFSAVPIYSFVKGTGAAAVGAGTAPAGEAEKGGQ